MPDTRIGDLAENTGTSAHTIRYHEQIGLLRRASRQLGGRCVYTQHDVERLTFIRQGRDLKLGALECSMIAFVNRCEASCTGGEVPDCVILEDPSRTGGRRLVRRRAS